jgi:TRAP transporter TAXI family solute receptor
MPIRIGTAEPNSTFLTQGLALKAILDERPGLTPVTIVESPAASIDNAKRLGAGDLEFGFMASNWTGLAKRGEPPFQQPIEIRIAAPMNAGPLFFIARTDSGIATASDLSGKRVAIGPESSGMAQHARLIFKSLGLSFSDFTPVHLDFAAGAEALTARRIDAQLQCPIPNKVMTELAEQTPVRVLRFEPRQLEGLIAAVPFYRRTTMRAGAFRGLERDIEQPAVVNVLVTHERVPEDVVQEAVSTILTDREELGRLNRLFIGMDKLFEPLRSKGLGELEFGGVEVHPGAARAYAKAGLLT